MSRTHSKSEADIFRDRSLYPASKIFKPAKLNCSLFSTAAIMRRLNELLNPVIPLTAQEAARRSAPSAGSALSSTDLRPLSDWVQKGIHWVRLVEGPHAHCWTSSRKDAHVLWRNADDYYCHHGFPYFQASLIMKMTKTMEVFKPVLLVRVTGYPDILIAMARSIAHPHGCCWGMSTLDTWFEVHVDGKPDETRLSITAVERVLSTIRKTALGYDTHV